jgi:hypothetical protein
MQNFRCFEDHTILLEPNTVVVGKNNAGKSSMIEALRLVAAVVNRKRAAFVHVPPWLDLPRFQSGIAPGISHLGLNLNAVFHRYGDPPAIITASFTGGAVISVYVGSEETIFAILQDGSGRITTQSRFLALNLPWVYVLPQIGPLLSEEVRITDERVSEFMTSRLSSRHFRNQLVRMNAEFSEFKRLAEETWHGLKIEPVRQTTTKSGALLSLDMRDADFVGEVGLMGHGLQMWLQTIWFLSRTPSNSTVVLDEPDVYMHPDLQRKLFRLARARYSQCIIATHSVEIMAESDPGNILIIDKTKRRSKYANDEPGVQLLIDQIGGIHNIHLARLWSARKFLLLEGKDIGLLKHFHSTLYPEAELPLDTIPTHSVGGWSGWTYAVGSSMAMKNAVGDRIVTYCILDSDYHSEGEIRARYEDAERRGVNLHVWSRKEIENYVLQPRAIRRVLAARMKDREAPNETDLWNKIIEICEQERRTVEDGIASALVQYNRKLDIITANKRSRSLVDNIWQTEDKRPLIVSGKVVLARLSEWTMGEFGTSFGAPAIARQMRKSDIPTELMEVIRAIEEGANFQSFEERRNEFMLHISDSDLGN